MGTNLLKTRTLYKKCIFVFTVLFLICLSYKSVYCEDAFLVKCMKIAESRDPKLMAAHEQVQLSRSRTIRAARSLFPQVMIQHTNSKGKTAMASDISGYEYIGESYGVKAAQALYEGYRTRGSYEYESMMVTASKYNYTKTREELFSKIKLAYYEYLTLKREAQTLGKAHEIVVGLFDKVKKEYKARAISQLDLLEAENFKDRITDMYEAAKINYDFSIKKLVSLVGIIDIKDVNVQPLDMLSDNVPEISFTLDSLMGLVLTNNLDVQTAKIQTEMAEMKIKINRSKVIPKFYIEGFYGRSGEAFTTAPLDLTTSWNVVGKLSWGLWGNSLEASYTQDKTDPKTIIDASKRIDTQTQDIKFSLLDDLEYFVESKESDVSFNQTNADYVETLKTKRLDTEKAYNDYLNSLNNARTLKKEIALRERKLALMKKRNALYEVQTVSLMEEAWKYAEAIASYAKATYQNYASVTEMEKLTLTPLR
ncbi:MAG: TolC family protein [Endomicrobium sp.]|nr:TolC family protein [Endomicrobium sp.]